MDRRRRMGGEPAFLVGSLTAHPEFVLDIARQRWQDWGYPSVEACAADVSDCGTESLPIRLVAVAEDAPIGVVNLIECNLPIRADLRPWLAGLYVWPDRRGHGVGSALCAVLEREASRLGFDGLYLWTVSAEGFYPRLGWSTIESSRWEGAAIAIMAKPLGR